MLNQILDVSPRNGGCTLKDTNRNEAWIVLKVHERGENPERMLDDARRELERPFNGELHRVIAKGGHQSQQNHLAMVGNR